MNHADFINLIGTFAMADYPSSKLLPSVMIAQGIIESNWGESELAKKANNLFGMKANSKWNGKTYKVYTSEFYDGVTMETVLAEFRKYDSWYESMRDHSLKLSTEPRYARLVGETNYKVACQKLKDCGYATSPTYPTTLIKCIEKNNLTVFDNVSSIVQDTKNTQPTTIPTNKKILTVHAGHNPDGKIGCGAVGLLKESTCAREIVANVVNFAKQCDDVKLEDITVNDGLSQSDILNKLVKNANGINADLHVSVHLNAGANRPKKDGLTTGAEIWLYKYDEKTVKIANKILKELELIGYKNRGIKYSKSLGFLKRTTSKAMLIECCFVDDFDDYVNYNSRNIAIAIMRGLTECEFNTKELVINNELKDSIVTTTVTGDYVNLRNYPNGQKIGQTRKGDFVFIIASYKNGWSKVEVGGVQGYIYSKYLGKLKPLI